MDYALKRQLTFIVVFVITLFALAVAAQWFAAPEPTCFDGIRNQGEEQIDCGGPLCQACKVGILGDIQILSQRAFFVGGAYDAIAQVRNPNPRHGSNTVAYAFVFYDDNKTVLAERAGETFLLAGQTRSIVESNITVPREAASVNFSVNRVGMWEEQNETLAASALPIFSERYERAAPGEIGYAKVTGTVENKTEYTFRHVAIHVMLVDGDGNPVAVGVTAVDDLRFGEGRSFMVLFPHAIPLPTEIHSEAVTNLFDPANVN